MFSFFKKNFNLINMDAWSDGQVASKLWLCQELERVSKSQNQAMDCIWFLGSWYGTLPFMLLAREVIRPRKIICFDVDVAANKLAYKILNHWMHSEVEILIRPDDCLRLDFGSDALKKSRPDVVVNTSCEHMESLEWWDRIPTGTLFAVQSTNMEHPTHVSVSQNLQEFLSFMSPAQVFYSGTRSFEYPELKFDRFMVIGRKL